MGALVSTLAILVGLSVSLLVSEPQLAVRDVSRQSLLPQPCAGLWPGPDPLGRGHYSILPGPESLVASLDSLVKFSSTIVVATVTGSQCQLVNTGDELFVVNSYYQVTVDRALLGNVPSHSFLTIAVPGVGRIVDSEGRWYQTTVTQFDVPRVGDRLVFFLSAGRAEVAAGRDGVFEMSKFGYGAFLLSGGRVRALLRSAAASQQDNVSKQNDGKSEDEFVLHIQAILNRL